MNKAGLIKGLVIVIILIIFIVGAVTIYKHPWTGKIINAVSKGDNMNVKLETNYGDIIIELYEEMPVTAENFKKLVEDRFYDGTIFHRIIEGFMIQGGDPTRTGSGGPGYTIKDEFTGTDLDRNSRGTISMANAGPNTGGSQFFINLVDNNYLDGKHPVFGKVVEGMDVVDKIGKVETDRQDKPLKDVVIEKASII